MGGCGQSWVGVIGLATVAAILGMFCVLRIRPMGEVWQVTGCCLLKKLKKRWVSVRGFWEG